MGTIVGLYEAYMTKILWSPTWNPSSFQIGGVAVAETLMLVFFWHPVMAFMVPLIFSERFLNLRPVIIPGLGIRWVNWLSGFRFYLIFGTLAGLILGTLLANPGLAFQVCLLNSILMGLLLMTWNFISSGISVSFKEVLPSGKSWWVFLLLLMVDFLALGLLVRPEAIPPISHQVTIWILYAGLGYLVYRACSRQVAMVQPDIPNQPDTASPSPIRLWGAFILTFTSACLIASILLAPFNNIGFLTVYIFGIPSGLFLFYRSIRWTLSK
jgi:phage tail protein X